MAKLKTVAAIDLGSNSFHLIVAQIDGRRLRVVDRLREMVRLAAGLDDSNQLTLDVQERAIACLNRFAQRLRDLPASCVRVVGTNTLRKARNSQEFVDRAEQVLGHSIDVIAGREEARLIYLGVSQSLEDSAECRLVVDIGGGSTELVLGRHSEPQQMESLYMGCVSVSQTFFASGDIDAERFKLAELTCLQELEPVQQQFLEHGWDTAIGASGTCIAINDAIESREWTQDGITIDGLRQLRRSLIKAGHVNKLNLPLLSKPRAPVFAGGVAVLLSVFRSLSIQQMQVANGALREGLIYDLLGRIRHEDVRDRAITELMDHYRVDDRQVKRVTSTALRLYEQVKNAWNISIEGSADLLRRATSLHEIGLAIAHNQYHKHNAYLVHHMDLSGFGQGEQRRLATLIRGHRRKFPIKEFEKLPNEESKVCEKLCILLRIAVVLHRSRARIALPAIQSKATPGKLKLRFPVAWLDDHPLTAADLVQEAEWLRLAGCCLTLK